MRDKLPASSGLVERGLAALRALIVPAPRRKGRDDVTRGPQRALSEVRAALRRPNSRASAPSASSNSTSAHSSRSLSPTWLNQPPCWTPPHRWVLQDSVKRDVPLITIFPRSVLFPGAVNDRC